MNGLNPYSGILLFSSVSSVLRFSGLPVDSLLDNSRWELKSWRKRCSRNWLPLCFS